MKTPLALKAVLIASLSLLTIVILAGAWFFIQQYMPSAGNQGDSDSGNARAQLDDAGAKIQELVAKGKYKQANAIYIENVPDMKKDFDKAWPLRSYFEQAFHKKSRERSNDESNSQRWQSLLDQKKYADLERIYDDFVSSKSQRPNGEWNASFFLTGVCLEEDPADDRWEPHIARLNDWIKSKPNSYLAKLLLARTMVDYAWHARGSGYANTISDEGGKLFGTRLENALKTLMSISVRTPNWYSIRQTIALGQGMDRAEYDKVVEEGRRKFPDFALIVTNKVYFLLPRWYGQEGDAERYLDSECSKLDKVHGDILYAQAAMKIETSIANAMNNCAFSWPRTKDGMLALIQKNPDWIYGRCLYSILAMEAGDKASANTAFDVSGKKQ
ncbi:MAG: DUF4034 domain-containing protein [Candidatus Obscuribacterales bacterium]|nr:DUF4034 domain-containing protein [Candidatus Obscuribacterales bacterium]